MKKVLISFILIALLSLCSCRKVNENLPDGSDYTSDISSNYYHSSADNVLPERDEPTVSHQNSNESSASNGEESETVDPLTDSEYVSLTIETEQPYYKNTVKGISFTLYNRKKNIFSYNTDFFLQKYDGKKWVYYPTKNGKTDYGTDTEQSDMPYTFLILSLQEKYDLPLEYGTYRIVQENDDSTITSNSFQIVDESFFNGQNIE